MTLKDLYYRITEETEKQLAYDKITYLKCGLLQTGEIAVDAADNV
jgi:hypothetical protein